MRAQSRRARAERSSAASDRAAGESSFAYGRGPAVAARHRPLHRHRRVRRDRGAERRREDDAAASGARSRDADARRGAALRRAGARFSRRATIGYLAQRAQLGIDAPVDGPRGRRGRPPRRGRAPRPAPPTATARSSTDAIERVGLSAARRSPAACGSPAGSSSARSSPRRSPRSRRCSCSTSPRPASTSKRRKRSPRCSTGCTASSSVTVLYVSHEFGSVEQFVERLVLVRGLDRLRRSSPASSRQIWHDPSHMHA